MVNSQHLDKGLFKICRYKSPVKYVYPEYDEYVRNSDNKDRCKITNICNRSTYLHCKYLNDIEFPQIKSIFY